MERGKERGGVEKKGRRRRGEKTEGSGKGFL
jgi:hypothetical protein